jgi:alpha-mannosidase
MTSPQWFETVENPFTALQFADLSDGQRGLLVLHDGSQAMLRDGEQVQHLLTLYDPWDEDYFVSDLDVRVRLIPHGFISHAERWRLAQEFTRPVLVTQAKESGGDLPARSCLLFCDAPNVLATALYRETEEAGRGLSDYAGAGLGYPFVLRLVEFDGAATTARLCFSTAVAAAWRTNLLGEIAHPLTLHALVEGGSALVLELKPYEIATLYLDLVEGRKQPRDLDARRSVWATVHRTQEA